jgi:Fe-S-cluster containining protein
MLISLNPKNPMDCDISICKSLCCHNCAVLTGDEVSELIKNARMKYGFELESKKYFRNVEGEHGSYFAVRIIRGQCIFLNKENQCRIYGCRPILCDLYPVIDVDAVDERCPIANKLPKETIDVLKQRYEEEVDERIKAEKTFMFV